MASAPRAPPSGAPSGVPVGAKFSMVSEAAVSKLADTDEELSAIEDRVKEIHGIVSNYPPLSQLKTELALLESKAKQLEATGVDDVYTGDLSSGKQVARATKKDMLKRLEA